MFSVRLAPGTVPYEGRVEVRQGTTWGTICDDHWTINEALAACRSVNFG